MSNDLIEGMAKASIGKNYGKLCGDLRLGAGPASAEPCDCIRIVLDDKEAVRKMMRGALAYLADPQNITPEMVEAAWDGLVNSMLADTTEKGHAHVKAALTAALTAAEEA